MTPGELAEAKPFNALTDIYLSHPTHCPCPSCTSMDELLAEMCNEPGCRTPSAPGIWGCEGHPNHRPRTQGEGSQL